MVVAEIKLHGVTRPGSGGMFADTVSVVELSVTMIILRVLRSHLF